MKGFKPVKGFEKYYFINRKGQIMNNSGRMLRPYDNGSGYQKINLYNREGDKTSKYIHILVAEAFLTKPDGFVEVDHIDRDRKNNHIKNLRYASKSQNAFNRAPRS